MPLQGESTKFKPGNVKNPAGRPVAFRTITADVAKRIRRSAPAIAEVCIAHAMDGGPGSAECAAALMQMMSTAELVQALSRLTASKV